MPRLPGLDPEVLADLARREASETDRERSRPAPGSWQPPAIVEHWPCRGGCGQMIGVTRDAIERFETFNSWLARRREPPLLKAKIMWCPDCKARDDELAALQRGSRQKPAQTELPGTAVPTDGKKRRMT